MRFTELSVWRCGTIDTDNLLPALMAGSLAVVGVLALCSTLFALSGNDDFIIGVLPIAILSCLLGILLALPIIWLLGVSGRLNGALMIVIGAVVTMPLPLYLANNYRPAVLIVVPMIAGAAGAAAVWLVGACDHNADQLRD